MKIWYDACTGKHIRYGTVVARRLRKKGHEVIFTTREHPDTLALARILGEKPIVVGKWNPGSLATRMEESARRMLKFAEMFRSDPPDIAISHQSVELCRVAFGLGIPSIVTADTPHATSVNRLTVPLSTTLLASEAIPQSVFSQFGVQSIVQFRGVDEVAWIKDLSPLGSFSFKRPLIVIRQVETKSAYALEKRDVTIEAARKLVSLGTVVFLARYPGVGSRARARNGFIVMDDFVDSANLAREADMVVSVGGTIAREAALQGTPSIVMSEFGRIHVNEYLSKKGFPLFTVTSSKVLAKAKEYLGKKPNVMAKLAALENPADIIERIATNGFPA